MTVAPLREPGIQAKVQTKAFTLLELLVSITIVAVLGSFLLSAASRSKALADATRCRNQLRQIGVAMTVYLIDSRRYPPMWDAEANDLWADKLNAPRRHAWTNADWNCPTYCATKGFLGFSDPENLALSYSYNWRGTATGWSNRGKKPLPMSLGLGHLSKDEVNEPEVSAPSEMYAVADVRGTLRDSHLFGNPKMSLYRFPGAMEAPAPHQSGYNILFADAHALQTKRIDYLFPPRSAHSWNRDNQAHSETWAPQTEWAATP